MAQPTNHVDPHGLSQTLRHYLGDLVYGANDGLVTTFAAAAAVEGGALSATTVLIVGTANLAADGLSMGIGNYLAIKAREDAREADNLPNDETQPMRHGVATFASFVLIGAIPLLPYATGAGPVIRRYASIGLTLVSLFVVGAARGRITRRSPWPSGLEVLTLGAVAGGAAYAAGALVARALAGR